MGKSRVTQLSGKHLSFCLLFRNITSSIPRSNIYYNLNFLSQHSGHGVAGSSVQDPTSRLRQGVSLTVFSPRQEVLSGSDLLAEFNYTAAEGLMSCFLAGCQPGDGLSS